MFSRIKGIIQELSLGSVTFHNLFWRSASFCHKKHGLTIHVFNTGFLAVSPNPWRFVAVERLALQKLIGLCFSILEEHFSFHFPSSPGLIKLPGFFFLPFSFHKQALCFLMPFPYHVEALLSLFLLAVNHKLWQKKI